MQTVADHIIEKCGGYKNVAEWLGLNISSVYRFTYPRSKGGTDGLIPAEHQAPLIVKAREHGIDLGPDDFFAQLPAAMIAVPDGSGEPCEAAE